MATVGERIVQARKGKGWERPKLAMEARVPYPTLAGLENGDQKTSTALPQIAQALGVHALWLAEGRGPMWITGSGASTEDEGQTSGIEESKSQPERLDPGIIAETLMLLGHEEGPARYGYTLAARTARFLELYALIAADGGRLTKEHNAEFELEAQARKRGMEGGGDFGKQRTKR